MAAALRLELFPKSLPHLQEHLLPFVSRQQELVGVNLPNKAKGELPSLLEQSRALHAALAPAADICVHYSIAHNYARTPEASFQALERFTRQLALEPGRRPQRCSLLLVSGSQRRRLDSLQALELLAGSPQFAELGLPLAVAFNPYIPEQQQQAEERQRLRRKLLAGRGHVSAIYLQAGSDAQRLAEGLLFLQQLLEELEQQQGQQQAVQQQQGQQQGQALARPAKRARKQEACQLGVGVPCTAVHECSADASADARGEQGAAARLPEQPPAMRPTRPALYGSLMLPSKRFLAQMRFRPWSGVFLSQEYLSGVEEAEAATVQVLRVYRQHGVVPLVETQVATEAEMHRLQHMLAEATKGE